MVRQQVSVEAGHRTSSGSEQITSGEFCSGQVEPQSTSKVEFSIPGVNTFCKPEADQKWSEVCAFVFDLDAASVASAAGKARTLEEAFGVEGRAGATKRVPPAATPGGGESNDPPPGSSLSKAEIQAGMRLVKDRVQACFDRFRVPGTAQVELTIAPSGTISATKLKGVFAGTPTGTCLEAAARFGTFRPFKGQVFTIDYPFVLR